MKHGVGNNEHLRRLHQHKNVTVVDGFAQGLLLYHLLFADMIFIQNSSTAFCECILVNPNVIEFHINYHNDNLELKKHGLLMTHNLDDVDNTVEKFFNKTLLTEEYMKNRERYIDFIYGQIDKTNHL
jgi:hypothetical protein